MTDKITPERRSANMSKIRSRDTSPELAVRRAAHALGYRYRLHRKDLPGKPDLVFPGRKAVIFVHGCFWHQHPDPACPDGRRPKSRPEYWNPKLDANVARDALRKAELEGRGWRVLTLWECDIGRGADLAETLKLFLGLPARRTGAGSGDMSG
ncbi:very short patch repair endonuclease [Brevundimonas sp. BR2-1]|uniref:very short patch repair endonuclease n=1 Tax=Brevundimonas sp. BR2-1 TaxID=3031123 RepID=UPI0030AB441F